MYYFREDSHNESLESRSLRNQSQVVLDTLRFPGICEGRC